MYRLGIVSAVDGDTHRVRVKFPSFDNVESKWLPVLARGSRVVKDVGLPVVDTQVACLLDERAEDGVVLGSVFSEVDPPPVVDEAVQRLEFGDGGLVEHNRDTHVLRVVLHASGQLELAGSAEAIALAGKCFTQFQAIAAATHSHGAGAMMAGGTPVTGSTGPSSIGYSAEEVGSAQVRSA